MDAQSKAQNRWSLAQKLMPGALYELGEMAYNVLGYINVSRVVKKFTPDFIYDRYVSYNYSAVGVGRRNRS